MRLTFLCNQAANVPNSLSRFKVARNGPALLPVLTAFFLLKKTETIF
jgi:hypothetical protein